jgi:hypothetical protein
MMIVSIATTTTTTTTRYVEETATIFRALAYLLKYLAPYLIKQRLALLDRFYGPLLGHRKP